MPSRGWTIAANSPSKSVHRPGRWQLLQQYRIRDKLSPNAQVYQTVYFHSCQVPFIPQLYRLLIDLLSSLFLGKYEEHGGLETFPGFSKESKNNISFTLTGSLHFMCSVFKVFFKYSSTTRIIK